MSEILQSPGITAADLDFSGKRVLVTGAASGIGEAMARAFHAHRATVLLADRNEAGLAALAVELGDAARFAFDQSDPASIRKLAAAAMADGPVDVLMNNAGISLPKTLLEANFEEIENVLQIDLVGPVLMARAFASAMAENGAGVIINTASQLAFAGAATRSAYAAAKAGVAQFTAAAAAELAPLGVRMAAIAPGRTYTPMTRRFLDDPGYAAESLKRIPAGRHGKAEEIARLALLLASPVCSYVVGETLIVDGGYVVA